MQSSPANLVSLKRCDVTTNDTASTSMDVDHLDLGASIAYDLVDFALPDGRRSTEIFGTFGPSPC